MSKITILGGAGFIGTNLILELAKNPEHEITAVDAKLDFFDRMRARGLSNVTFKESLFGITSDFEELVRGQDILIHLVSSVIPAKKDNRIPEELMTNTVATSRLLEACVACQVKRVIFMSSGGAVYGKNITCPIREDSLTYPITSYGVQKDAIEKLLYLYHYQFGLDYRIIRLANPFGPYQRPNGVLGAATTFTYRALKHEPIQVYGDGSVIRDYIYIDDVVHAIQNLLDDQGIYKTYNVGSGVGTSVNELLELIQQTLKTEVAITYTPGRVGDVPVNYLDISRYESQFGTLVHTSLEEGIQRTADFFRRKEGI